MSSITYLYDLRQEISTTLTVDQITSNIILGDTKLKGVYDPEVVYSKGDIVPYIDENGVVKIYQCTIDGATGDPINLDYWKEFSIIGKLNDIEESLIVLSAIRPVDTQVNRVWIRAKSDGSGSVDLGDNIGIIVLNNFILSSVEPNPFTSDLVWGKITYTYDIN